MAESAHACGRGSTAQFYDWLGSEAGLKAIPSGPPLKICGDCHIGNLGPVADSEGNMEIQIRDLDQTVIGNPAHSDGAENLDHFATPHSAANLPIARRPA